MPLYISCWHKEKLKSRIKKYCIVILFEIHTVIVFKSDKLSGSASFRTLGADVVRTVIPEQDLAEIFIGA